MKRASRFSEGAHVCVATFPTLLVLLALSRGIGSDGVRVRSQHLTIFVYPVRVNAVNPALSVYTVSNVVAMRPSARNQAEPYAPDTGR